MKIYIITTNIRINLKRLYYSWHGKPCGVTEYLSWNPVDVYVKICKDMGVDINELSSKRLKKLKRYCNETLSFPRRPTSPDYLDLLNEDMENKIRIK